VRTPLLAAVVWLAACRPAVEDTPEAAYRAFAAAANQGEDKAAFDRLTSASQQALTRQLAGLSAASGGSMREDASALVFRGGRGPPITDVRLLKKDQDRATVAVTAHEQRREVNLQREGAVWRVELPGLP
jgi:hypothetical protein